MPKYFEGTRDLPSGVITLQHDAVYEDTLEKLLSKKDGRVALSVKFPGLPANSLGYVFIIETKGNTHSVMDIKDVVHFRGISTNYLSKIIRHAAGIEFDAGVQAEFHRIRNEIGID